MEVEEGVRVLKSGRTERCWPVQMSMRAHLACSLLPLKVCALLLQDVGIHLQCSCTEANNGEGSKAVSTQNKRREHVQSTHTQVPESLSLTVSLLGCRNWIPQEVCRQTHL